VLCHVHFDALLHAVVDVALQAAAEVLEHRAPARENDVLVQRAPRIDGAPQDAFVDYKNK